MVGGGFSAIIGAYFLARAGHEVRLVDGAPFLGGVLHSDQWDEFFVDKGCHLFGNSSDENTSLIHNIMDDEVWPVEVKYAAVTEGRFSDGLAVPDYSGAPPAVRARMLYEVTEAAAAPESPAPARHLHECLRRRFGKTLARRLAGAVRKMFQIEPERLDAAALGATPFGRIRVVPDQQGRMLKLAPALDERLAASSQDEPLRYYRDQATRYPYRNYYPRHRGMRGFCDRAGAYLAELGVDLKLGSKINGIGRRKQGLAMELDDGESISSELCLWTSGPAGLAKVLHDDDKLADQLHRVPMVLYYFAVPRERVGDYTYIHDYDEESLVFRASAPGVYGRQTNQQGETYVCLEVPTRIGSPVWEESDEHRHQVWREACDLHLVTGPCPATYKVLRTPVSYQIACKGYTKAAARLEGRLGRLKDRLVLSGHGFAKDDIISTLRDRL